MISLGPAGLYLKSVGLENVRCFSDSQRVSFMDKESNSPSYWNVIIGENGTGKTSILRAISLALINPEHGKKWMKHVNLNSFKRQGAKLNPKININAEYAFREDLKLGLELYMNEIGGIGYPGQIEIFDEQLVLFAYGATRKTGVKGFANEETFPAISLFDEDASLINAEEWIIQTDYLALKNPKYLKRKNMVLEAIKKLVPNDIIDIKIVVDKTPRVFFETRFGLIPYQELSLGHKTLLAWLTDFAKGLLEKYPDSEKPFEEPAICLIDEIDLHIHPGLQNDVVEFLKKTFPRTQFIVTSHSPLIVSSGYSNTILLKKRDNSVKIINDPEIIRSWRYDQVLTSGLFGLKDSRPREIVNLLNERTKLLSQEKLSETDNVRLKEIEIKLGKIEYYDNMNEKRAYNAIDKIIEIMTKNKKNDSDTEIE